MPACPWPCAKKGATVKKRWHFSAGPKQYQTCKGPFLLAAASIQHFCEIEGEYGGIVQRRAPSAVARSSRRE